MFKSLRAKLSNIRKDIEDIYKFIKDTLLPIITNGLDESVGRFTDTLAKLRVSITEAVKTFLTDTVEDARESRRDVSIVITKLIEFVNSKLPQDEKREQLKAFLGYVKTSNLSVQEKDEWIQKIQSKLGLVTRDSKREKELLAQIEAGAADIDDIV
jgi:uncharacterized coiled-coil DUF342 family protein